MIHNFGTTIAYYTIGITFKSFLDVWFVLAILLLTFNLLKDFGLKLLPKTKPLKFPLLSKETISLSFHSWNPEKHFDSQYIELLTSFNHKDCLIIYEFLIKNFSN